MSSTDWMRAVCVVVLCVGAQASAAIVQLDLGSPPATLTDTYESGKQNYLAVLQGDGNGALKLNNNAVPKDASGCQSVTHVKECFKLPTLADGSTLRGTYTQGGTTVAVALRAMPVAVPVTSAPAVGTADGKCGEGATTNPRLQQAYLNAIARTDLSVEDQQRLAKACPRHVYEGDTAILFYDAEGKSLFAPLPQVDEDDSVQFVFFSEAGDLKEARVTKCTAAQAFRISGSLADLAGSTLVVTSAGGKEDLYQVAQRCSADDGIEVKVKAGSAENMVSTQTLPLYRLSLGLGLVYDNTRVTDYRLADVKGESVPVIIEDTHAVGLNAVAMLSLNVFKNDLTRSPWDFWAKGECGKALGLLLLNPTLGVSLSHPLDHLYFGNTLAVYPGLGLTFGWHVYRAPHLAEGYQVGDRFEGGTEVPVDMRWAPLRAGNFYLGANVDTAVLAKILAGLKR
ncbi:hypothetical protein ACQKGO_26490 [Corallococcus interemptor]|uniref:hypothetical protein n=1 Tax=Corallococcus interemptor TaxID=2316720 RepID=UPI003CFC0C97